MAGLCTPGILPAAVIQLFIRRPAVFLLPYRPPFWGYKQPDKHRAQFSAWPARLRYAVVACIISDADRNSEAGSLSNSFIRATWLPAWVFVYIIG